MTNQEKSAFAELAGHTNRVANELADQGSSVATNVRRIARKFERMAEIPQMVPDQPPTEGRE
jgi:tRNA splicing ligase